MNNEGLLKRGIAGILYLAGIAFALYVSFIIIEGKSMFTTSGLIISMLGVCVPIGLATFLLIWSINNIEKRYRVMKVCMFIVLGFYCILLIAVLYHNGFRNFEGITTVSISDYIKGNTNFILFKTIIEYIQHYSNGTVNKSTIYQNMLGNLFLFSPMGILLPCLFKRLRRFKAFIGVMIVVLVSVELGQLLTRCGSSDIDDVILNLFGAILFYGLWRLRIMQWILRKLYIM